MKLIDPRTGEEVGCVEKGAEYKEKSHGYGLKKLINVVNKGWLIGKTREHTQSSHEMPSPS